MKNTIKAGFFATLFTVTLSHANELLSIRNEYGDTIIVRKGNNLRSEEITLTNKDEKFLGILNLSLTSPELYLSSLQIKTSRILSSFTSLDDYLKQVRAQYKERCDSDKAKCSDEAVLVVHTSSIVDPWKISIEWVPRASPKK